MNLPGISKHRLPRHVYRISINLQRIMVYIFLWYVLDIQPESYLTRFLRDLYCWKKSNIDFNCPVNTESMKPCSEDYDTLIEYESSKRTCCKYNISYSCIKNIRTTLHLIIWHVFLTGQKSQLSLSLSYFCVVSWNTLLERHT